jgi:hypothetical protein
MLDTASYLAEVVIIPTGTAFGVSCENKYKLKQKIGPLSTLPMVVTSLSHFR